MRRHSEMHADVRTRLIALLRERGPESVAGIPVPACPEWTVRDTVAHLAGVADDVLAGRLDGVATEPWTAAQVEARRDRSLTEILGEWDELDPQVEVVADGFGPVASQWLFDCLTHDADIRGAIGEPVVDQPDALLDALGFGTKNHFIENVAGGRPVARFRSGGHEWVSKDGQFAATVEAPLFELFRGLAGRRSISQIASWDWDVDPEPVLGSFTWGPFVPPPDPLDV